MESRFILGTVASLMVLVSSEAAATDTPPLSLEVDILTDGGLLLLPPFRSRSRSDYSPSSFSSKRISSEVCTDSNSVRCVCYSFGDGRELMISVLPE